MEKIITVTLYIHSSLRTNKFLTLNNEKDFTVQKLYFVKKRTLNILIRKIYLPDAVAGPTPFKFVRAVMAWDNSFGGFLKAFLLIARTDDSVLIRTKSVNLGRNLPL